MMVGPPKKHFLPLILFTSLFALFFFTHYHNTPSLRISNNGLTPITAPANFQNSHTVLSSPPSAFNFIIKVLAYNRLASISRCLQSLASADYGGDTVHLHIYVDHFTTADGDNNSSVTDQNLKNSHSILDFVDGFEWRFGSKVVHYRTSNAGLQAQWLEAWWPSSDDEFAFVVEDDLEVSPLFYKFVKGVIVNYYYNSSNFNPYIYGVTLQRPRFVPGKHGNKMKLEGERRIFLYQLVGTWGQILFPRPWKEFRLWYDDHKSKGIKPFLDGMVTNGWYKKMGERIWTPWFIKFIHSRGYFNVYTNFQHERALSVSHRDTGVNYGKTAGPDSQLLNHGSLDFNLLEMPPLRNLRWYDFCFREVLPGRIIRTLDELGSILMSVQRQQSVLLVSIFGTSEMIIRNMICHFEKQNISNYIFISPASDLLFDLARRGHPVINSDELLNSLRSQKLLRIQDSTTKLVEDVLVKAFVVKKCLDSGFNSAIADTNILFISNNPFQELLTPNTDFYAGKSLEFFIARSSSSAQRDWNDVLKRVASISSETSAGFVQVVSKFLEQNGVTITRLDEEKFGLQTDSTNGVSQSSSRTGKAMFYWSNDTSLDSIRGKLEELSLWAVDGDSSCTAVVCNQS